MGDRCFIEITMRREDLSRFGAHVHAEPGAEWWDRIVDDNPDTATVSVLEANYGWYDERVEAASAGIPFYGTHSEGGEYGPYAFASWKGIHREAPLDCDGDMVVPVGEDLKPLYGLSRIRKYLAVLRKVRAELARPLAKRPPLRVAA